jgi:hypothetical protein
MRLEQALREVGEFTPQQFGDVRRHIDPDWIEAALRATGTATLRKRRLPAVQVIWLVIALALFRSRPIWEIVDKLNLALPGASPTVARSAIIQARGRLGPEPMAWLFRRSAQQWAHRSANSHSWRGLALYGVDGSTLRVADSKENRRHFGGSNGRRGQSGYPLVRVVGLMALRSHLLADVAFGPYRPGEHSYAVRLWSQVPHNSLSIVDKGFFAAKVLIPLARDGENRHWLTRGKKNLSWRVVKRFSRRDMLVEMAVSRSARAKDPSLPKTWTVRVVRYQRKGFRPGVVLTSLLDPQAYPADEMVALYHERWELELGYDEIKTEMLERKETLRSKSPSAVTQEMYGLFLAYNLVRLEIESVADEAGVEPTRISFVAALRFIVDEWQWLAITSPGAIPVRLRELRANLKRFILPARRPERRYPRAVKIKMSNYPRKRPVSKRRGVK